jgi:hypothetical protein
MSPWSRRRGGECEGGFGSSLFFGGGFSEFKKLQQQVCQQPLHMDAAFPGVLSTGHFVGDSVTSNSMVTSTRLGLHY